MRRQQAEVAATAVAAVEIAGHSGMKVLAVAETRIAVLARVPRVDAGQDSSMIGQEASPGATSTQTGHVIPAGHRRPTSQFRSLDFSYERRASRSTTWRHLLVRSIGVKPGEN